MQSTSETGASIAISVAIVAAVMIGIFGIFMILFFAFGWEPPSSAGLANSVVATIAGINWFARKADRRMAPAERLWFALGVGAVNVLLPTAYVIGSLLYVGLPVTIANTDLILAEGRGFITRTFILWTLVIGFVIMFAITYGLAAALPRKFSKRAAV